MCVIYALYVTNTNRIISHLKIYVCLFVWWKYITKEKEIYECSSEHIRQYKQIGNNSITNTNKCVIKTWHLKNLRKKSERFLEFTAKRTSDHFLLLSMVQKKQGTLFTISINQKQKQLKIQITWKDLITLIFLSIFIALNKIKALFFATEVCDQRLISFIKKIEYIRRESNEFFNRWFFEIEDLFLKWANEIKK